MVAAAPRTSLAVYKLLVDQPRNPAAPRQRSDDRRGRPRHRRLRGPDRRRRRHPAAHGGDVRGRHPQRCPVPTPTPWASSGPVDRPAPTSTPSPRCATSPSWSCGTAPRNAPNRPPQSSRHGARGPLPRHPRDVVQRAHILCTLTPSVDPLVHADDLHPGRHVNAVGSPPRPGTASSPPTSLVRSPRRRLGTRRRRRVRRGHGCVLERQHRRARARRPRRGPERSRRLADPPTGRSPPSSPSGSESRTSPRCR